jgi:hypothetical protein
MGGDDIGHASKISVEYLRESLYRRSALSRELFCHLCEAGDVDQQDAARALAF